MAEAISQEEDSFTCPVCRDLLKETVTLLCGHNFCKRCIKGCWDQEDQKGVYSCPLCKHTFTPRPVLYKNPLIAEMIEKFGKTGIQATVPAQCYAGPGDVECDVCTGRKLKAVKSCLECLVSYCKDHFKDHNRLNRGRKHSVIDATGQLQERTCSEHKKKIEVFCRTDQKCICYKCMMKEHKDHDTVTVEEEWKNKQKQLKKNQRRIQERERELQEQLKAVKIIKSSAQTAVEDSERIFTEMICSIVRRYTEVSRAEGLLKQLEQEIAELKRRDAVLEQLSHTEDHIHFLKIIPSIRELPHSKDLITLSQSVSSEAVKESVSALKVQLEEKMDSTFKQQVDKLSAAVSVVQDDSSESEHSDPELPVRRTNKAFPPSSSDPELPVRRTDSYEALPPYMSEVQDDLSKAETRKEPLSDVQAVFTEPVTREEFLKYSCHFTLDPNTAHRHLHLSEGNRRVEGRAELQSYPDHPERFDRWYQVLCREGVSGRCYWEVERSGEWVAIAVSYKSISRKGQGNECGFGGNDQSWILLLSSSSSSFYHNDKETKLPLVASSRIGVYVDHRAGTLAFYSISDTMTLLHRVQTTFTHTLYPGFWIDTGSAVKLL